MTLKVCESTVESPTLEWFEGLGYNVLSGPKIAPGEPVAEGSQRATHVSWVVEPGWPLSLSCEMLAYSSTDAIVMLWFLLGLIRSWPTLVEILPTRMAHLVQHPIESIFRKLALYK